MTTLVLVLLLVIVVRCSSPIASDSELPGSGLLTVTQVCNRVPGARGAKRLHPATVTRWILSGCPARDGTRVRLRATRVGSRWMILPSDLDNFFSALAADPAQQPTVPQQKKAEQRSQASRRAADELARRGA